MAITSRPYYSLKVLHLSNQRLPTMAAKYHGISRVRSGTACTRMPSLFYAPITPVSIIRSPITSTPTPLPVLLFHPNPSLPPSVGPVQLFSKTGTKFVPVIIRQEMMSLVPRNDTANNHRPTNPSYLIWWGV